MWPVPFATPGRTANADTTGAANILVCKGETSIEGLWVRGWTALARIVLVHFSGANFTATLRISRFFTREGPPVIDVDSSKNEIH